VISEFGCRDFVTAIMKHKCGECKRVIEAGKRYQIETGRAEGEWFIRRTCMICYDKQYPHHCGDDAGHAKELRRQTEAAVKAWEADHGDAA
jgi:hypothetical protein